MKGALEALRATREAELSARVPKLANKVTRRDEDDHAAIASLRSAGLAQRKAARELRRRRPEQTPKTNIVAPADYRADREALGTQEGVALLLGVSVRTLIRREKLGATREALLALRGLALEQKPSNPQG